MLANNEETDFAVLAKQFRELVASLLEVVTTAPLSVHVEPTPGGNFRGFDDSLFYVVRGGTINAHYRGRSVYTLEAGDILLPDIVGSGDESIAVCFASERGAQLDAYPALDFMQRVFSEPQAVRLWTRLLVTHSGLMLRIAATDAPETGSATPGFEVYQPGETIIYQGERPDYVFHMSAGEAEVLVDEVSVGRIGEGEIFGAMAALTQADRSATVCAKSTCSVVKVPTTQFTELIRSKPATTHRLMVDMAHSITNLNEQLVALRNAQQAGRV